MHLFTILCMCLWVMISTLMDTHVSLVSTCVWIYQHACLHVECLVWLASNVCVCVSVHAVRPVLAGRLLSCST